MIFWPPILVSVLLVALQATGLFISVWALQDDVAISAFVAGNLWWVISLVVPTHYSWGVRRRVSSVGIVDMALHYFPPIGFLLLAIFQFESATVNEPVSEMVAVIAIVLYGLYVFALARASTALVRYERASGWESSASALGTFAWMYILVVGVWFLHSRVRKLSVPIPA